MSHTSSYELSREVKNHLTYRGVDELDIFEILCSFCLAIVYGVGCDQRIYGMMDIAETDDDRYIEASCENPSRARIDGWNVGERYGMS